MKRKLLKWRYHNEYMDNSLSIKLFIIRKLYRHKIWKNKHTSIHNLHKGLPNNLRNSGLVKKVIKELLNNTLLLSKPTHYVLEVSLNPKKRKEIEELIE